MRLIGLAMSCALALACGGTVVTRSDLTVQGTLGGRSFAAGGAAFLVGGSGSGEYPFLQLSFTESADGCEDVLQSGGHSNRRVLRVYVYNERDHAPIAPGTYASKPVGTEHEMLVFVVWHDWDAVCKERSAGPSMWPSATVTFSDITASLARGSLKIDMDGDHLEGVFDATSCPPAVGGSCVP